MRRCSIVSNGSFKNFPHCHAFKEFFFHKKEKTTSHDLRDPNKIFRLHIYLVYLRIQVHVVMGMFKLTYTIMQYLSLKWIFHFFFSQFTGKFLTRFCLVSFKLEFNYIVSAKNLVLMSFM